MRLFPKTYSGLVTAAACVFTMSFAVLSAADRPVVASARDFIGGFTTSPKTDRVAASQQRSFMVSSGKAAGVLNTATSVVLTDFPVTPYSDAVVELERARPIIDGETVVRPNGRIDESYTLPSMQTFRGKIRGEDHSRVIMTVINGNIYSSVEHDNGERYVMTPAETAGKKEAREHTLFAESAVNFSPEEMQFTCLTPDDVELHDHDNSSKRTSKDRTLSTDLLEFQLAIETDYKLLQRFNMDDVRMQEYVFSLIAMVSSIYEDEINVTFRITDFTPWAETDPYQANGDISVMLGKFADYWRSRRSGVQRHIAHLITGPGSTGVGGIAFRDQLCNKFLGYSVSGIHGNYTYPTTSYTWDVNVIAHELGHNFRSHHTHACHVWGDAPLDTCVSTQGGITADDACFSMAPKRAPGSIMSYCHLLNGKVELTFTPPVAQVIREGAEDASCIQPPAQPTIAIQNPLGNQVTSAGSILDIRWTSARVSMVGIEYSINGGSSWTTIVDAVPATQRRYDWQVPSVSSKQMLVRVYDVSDAKTNDVSSALFEIAAPSLTLAYPVGGERLAQKSEITVKWDKVLVQSVAIDFSSNNGADWTTQVVGLATNEYKWTLPSVSTPNAMVRVRDENNNQVISQSAAFTIGAPMVQVSEPVAGTEWLAGTEQTIRWSSDFVDRVRIEYQVNGGDWKRIGPFFINASEGSYTWTVPNDISDNVVIRIRGAIGTEVPEGVSGVFAITNVVSVNEMPGIAAETFSITPQPANDQVTIGYTITAPTSRVRIALQDVTGRTVAEIYPDNLTVGRHSVELATAALTQGVYFVSIETGGTVVTRPLTIMH